MKTKAGFITMTTAVLFMLCGFLSTFTLASIPESANQKKILATYGNLPLYFVKNRGQLDPKIKFYVKTAAQTLYFTNEGIVFDLSRQKQTADGVEPEKERLIFNLSFEKSRKGVIIAGLNRQAATVNYFVGAQSNWKTKIPTYKGIIYQEIYPGIDLKIFGNNKDIEYEFIVNPGADPDNIRLTYNGIKGLEKNPAGELLINTAFGRLKESKPYIYQKQAGVKEVAGSFVIHSPADSIRTGKFSYGFKVASYNQAYPLIIDPTLDYSTYLGGSGGEDGNDIAVDSSGNAYIVGNTDSNDFPVTEQAYQSTRKDFKDVFISKLSSDGSTLIYATYLGGSSQDIGNGINVDSDGNAYIVGNTASDDFPVTNQAYQSTRKGLADVFVCKLSSNGQSLSYSTYLGGTGADLGDDIDIDSSGHAYVTGGTKSADFPVTADTYQSSLNGTNFDAFVTKLSSDGQNLIYSSYLGGAAYDESVGIAVNSSGNAYITGVTSSTDLPVTTGSYQQTNGGGNDAFICKLSDDGKTLSYSTYLGGNDTDEGYDIALDNSGNAYVTGYTHSDDFPVTAGAYQTSIGEITNVGPTYDVFITKLSNDGSSLSYSTYLGRNGADYGYDIAVDSNENACITGSSNGFFPTTNDAYQFSHGPNANSSAVISILSSDGSSLTYSTYLGGSAYDQGKGIAVDNNDNIYVVGVTTSSNFPVTTGAYQTTGGGSSADAFVAKLGNDAPPTNTLPTVTTQAVTNIGTNSATGNGTITGLGSPNPTAHGFCWNTTGAPTIGDNTVDIGGEVSATGSFSADISCIPATTYYVRAFATNDAGTAYGSVVSFTTLTPLPTPTAPTVTTQDVDDITEISATGHGNITDLGYPNPYQHGFCWNTSGSPTIDDHTVLLGAASITGAFSASITNLSPNTTYYVRAFATNEEEEEERESADGDLRTAELGPGISYGIEVSFTTDSAAPAPPVTTVPTVGTLPVSDITETSAIGHGTIDDLGNPNPTEHGFCWNTSGTPTVSDNTRNLGPANTTGAFSADITGLSPNTTYYLRAYASNEADGPVKADLRTATGISYGPQIYFTTDASAAIPTLNEWGMIIFTLLLAGMGYCVIRKQNA